MSELPYLIAIALIEQKGKRYMPLGGKSLKQSENSQEIEAQTANPIVLEVLLRVFEKSDKGSLRRKADQQSLLIAMISINEMQEKLPSLKREWIKTGDNKKFIENIKPISIDLCHINFIRYEGIIYTKI